ncbi:MAG: InlB B-repeat-containing protein [Clostridia bacterium]|nr:InlB B-repeat-containing protein [Clostridia bacterium]
MSKANRLYKIFMTSMIVIIAGILLACGVIAVKNSMRVKMSIPSNPNFLIEIYIQKDGSETKNLVFKNFGEVQIQNGISGLNANTLVASDDFVSLYGGDFSIIIKNFTENMPMLVTVTSTATLANGNDGAPAEINAEKSAAVAYDNANADEVKFNVANKAVFPQTTLLEIKFEQIDGYVVSFNANGGSGTMSAQQHALGASTALTECGFTAPAGKEFAGWATNANGSVEYTDGESVSNLKTKAGEEIMLYAVWQEPGYTITFAVNNWSAKIGGQETTSIVVEQNGSLTATLVGSGTQEGYSVHTAPTITGTFASTTFDRYTGTLTLTNIQSDLVISATDFRPWKYTKITEGGWSGYTYLTFANGTSGDWLIIGSGNNVANVLFDATKINAVSNTKATGSEFSTTGAQKEYTCGSTRVLSPTSNPYTFNTDGSRTTTQELANSELLLMKKELLANKRFDSSNAQWSESDMHAYLNGTYYTTDGKLSDYSTSIVKKTLKTYWYTGNEQAVDSLANNASGNNGIFLMGSRYGYFSSSQSYDGGACWKATYKSNYAQQNYCIEDYIGTWVDGKLSSNERLFDQSSYWWLRSGDYELGSTAYVVYGTGDVSRASVNYGNGVRPSFILNLA